MTKKSINSILIFRIGQLGDTLVGLPALKALRAHYPSHSLDLLYDHHVGSPYVLAEDLLRDTGLIDDFIPYPVARNFGGKLKALLSYPGLIERLRKRKYAMVYHLEPGQKTRLRHLRDQLFFRLAGISVQYASSPLRKPRPSARPLPAVEAEVDFYLRVLNTHGVSIQESPTHLIRLDTGEGEEREWSDWIGKHPVPEGRVPVGVGVGSKMQSKQWPLERFQEVLSTLCARHAVFPVFFGGPEDREAAGVLLENLGVGASACGDLSLKGSIRGLRDMTFYLGNDTGTMHMAVAAGKRCVAIFSARDVPGKWDPYGEGHRVHRVATECEGCMLTTCIENNKKCLTAIETDHVLASCESLLAELKD